jgi:hypothetical protein
MLINHFATRSNACDAAFSTKRVSCNATRSWSVPSLTNTELKKSTSRGDNVIGFEQLRLSRRLLSMRLSWGQGPLYLDWYWGCSCCHTSSRRGTWNRALSRPSHACPLPPRTQARVIPLRMLDLYRNWRTGTWSASRSARTARSRPPSRNSLRCQTATSFPSLQPAAPNALRSHHGPFRGVTPIRG